MKPKFKAGNLIYTSHWKSRPLLVLAYHPVQNRDDSCYDLLDGEEVIIYTASSVDFHYHKIKPV